MKPNGPAVGLVADSISVGMCFCKPAGLFIGVPSPIWLCKEPCQHERWPAKADKYHRGHIQVIGRRQLSLPSVLAQVFNYCLLMIKYLFINQLIFLLLISSESLCIRSTITVIHSFLLFIMLSWSSRLSLFCYPAVNGAELTC